MLSKILTISLTAVGAAILALIAINIVSPTPPKPIPVAVAVTPIHTPITAIKVLVCHEYAGFILVYPDGTSDWHQPQDTEAVRLANQVPKEHVSTLDSYSEKACNRSNKVPNDLT